MKAGDHRVPSYRRMPLVFTRGRGCRLFDTDGRGYLDLLSGIGVNALGHAHPRLTGALREQLGELMHVSNLYDHPLQEELARRLAEASGLDLVFFGNSGTESVEAALKMARRFQVRQGQDRPRLLALEDSFHGRSLGALSLTWSEQYRAPFEPL
ncbi:MAG: aspartate aminotransferase family protein, partial [Planctomycetota bacterium]